MAPVWRRITAAVRQLANETRRIPLVATAQTSLASAAWGPRVRRLAGGGGSHERTRL